MKETLLLESYNKKPVNYFGLVGEVDSELLGKFGWTNDICVRFDAHKKEIGDCFNLECVIECDRNILLEKRFKSDKNVMARRVKRIINGKLQTELIRVDESFTPQHVKELYLDIKKEIIAADHLLRLQHEEQQSREFRQKEMDHQERMLKLNIELEKIQLEKIRVMKLEVVRKNTPIVQQAPKSGGKKTVLQYDMQDKLIAKHTSIAAAAKSVGGSTRSIMRVCSGKQQAFKDYKWKLE